MLENLVRNMYIEQGADIVYCADASKRQIALGHQSRIGDKADIFRAGTAPVDTGSAQLHASMFEIGWATTEQVTSTHWLLPRGDPKSSHTQRILQSDPRAGERARGRKKVNIPRTGQ